MNLSSFRKQRILMGRDPEQNDIVLPENFVSNLHAKFKLVADTLWFADLGSTHGTDIYDGGVQKRLKGNQNYCLLRDGTILRIQYEGESILILYTFNQQEEMWIRYDMEFPEIRIGRNVENDIVLNHPSVSRVHAILKKEEESWRIRDNHSTNGVIVNFVPLENSMLLQDKDVIQIFNSRLIFTKTAVYYQNSMEGISLHVRNVNKFVGKSKKKILNNVCCDIRSNEFVAIIGGSGAGKTTLMNAISGFDENITGEVLCNGIPLHQNFRVMKNLIGYVPQQDIIYENLTLRKMLYYTAQLKMPADTQKQEMQKRIGDVLKMVELREHQSTCIRKLSGGQKKRASIAVELLADPSLFFLDEPTSGLDPGTEKKLMQTLSRLSKTQGKTIIMVTHTTSNLHLCDKVVFMGPGGKLCFYGTTEQAKMFFDTDNLVNIYNKIAEAPEMWAAQFAGCMLEEEKPQTVQSQIDMSKKHVNAFRQMKILPCRYMELIWNDRQRLLLLLLQPVLIAVLLTVVAAEHVFEVYDGTKSILFALSCAGIWIGLFNSIQEICKERVILKREYMGNLRLSAYMLSKYIVQFLIGLVQAFLMTVIFTLGVGKPEAGIFFRSALPELFLVFWFTILASMAMGFVVSGIVKSGDKAMTAAPFLLIIQLLFSGILFDLKGLGSRFSCLTISKWSVEGFGRLADLNTLPSKLQDEFPGYVREAEEMFQHTKRGIAADMTVLSIFMIVCLMTCIFVLRSVAKDSR